MPWRRGRGPFYWLLPAVFFFLLCILLWKPCFRALGEFLVDADNPEKAQAVVVLAGDASGERILKGAGLMRDGYAPKVIVSGPDRYYGRSEADLAIEFAIRRGFSASSFEPVIHQADSTREEAKVIWALLRKEGIRRFLVVTSDFHTRRAKRIYRSVAQGAQFRVIAAPVWNFSPDSWWISRPARKVFFMEWTKTFADWAGI
ncbi:MAG: YdcF family protein [Bryobacterales bacterium]|nr:YdcF family protein [Bryobacterales bacterium]